MSESARLLAPDFQNVGETEAAGVSVVLDEHLLTNPQRDMDYNGGGEITFSGARSNVRWLDHILGGIDRALSIDDPAVVWPPRHALAVGLLIFTPGDLRASEPVPGDRPYASLFFVSGGRQYVSAARSVVYDSSLTLGILGLAAAREVQVGLHDVTDSIRPQGWAHQVSAGGEPTARYSLARQSLIDSWNADWGSGDVKWTAAGSVGTITEGSVAVGIRWGRIASPWWTSTPELNTYVQDPVPRAPSLPADGPPEVFALLGARFKLRVYDAFLEGQFRHSDLHYSMNGLNPGLGEAWAGVAFRTSSGFELRYMARWESPELRFGIGSRSIVWGSLEVSKSF